MTTTDPPASDSTRIGPYRTLRELGRGGQAIVWLAEDSRIGRQIALKVLPHLGPGGEEAMRRFRREAEVAARLEHPAICGVLEADLDHGTPYIAMRYVQGETLARRIAVAREKGAAPIDLEALRELARFFETCARALHSAHEAGIVHRDVKPANLMVTPDGEPVILDFGLAREDDGTAHALSLTGEASGTPAYMSPEQMTSRSRPDRRSDVWSLGVALYEAAALAHPFASATREGLFQAILTEDPLDPRRTNRAIDRDLATILETATAKERDRRYQTALDFAEDLRRWRAHEPIRARPAGRIERLARWAQRKPALAASSAAILLLAIAASALLAYGVGASGRAEVEAELRAAAEEARSVADSERERAEVARSVADTERRRAEAARAAIVQAKADQALLEDLDELSMQMGTLWFGLEDVQTVRSLGPKFLAAFSAFGADLEHDVPGSIECFTALRERNTELWFGVQDSLESIAMIVSEEHSADASTLRSNVFAVRDAFPSPISPELSTAERRWREEGADTFGPLLTEEALADNTADELFDLGSILLQVSTRFDDAQHVLDRALLLDPSSFRLHFLIAGLGFMQVGQAMAGDPEDFRASADKLVHHMSVAVALRPRSGFVRAMLANAFALSRRYDEAGRCIEEAVELEPENALVWFLSAQFYGYTPHPERGVEACKRALELDPSLGRARELLAALEARVEAR